jgi:hypothetical protein
MSESRGKIRKPWVRPLTVARAEAVYPFFSTYPPDSAMKLHPVSAEINTVIKSPEQSTFRLIHGYG